MFITDAQLKTSLAAQLKVASESDVPAFFTNDILTRSNLAAYQDILGRLLARGFTKAQVDSWDRGAEFQTAIALYWCFVNAGMYGGYDVETLRALDRRKDLDKELVFASGVWIQPTDRSQPGLIVSAGPAADSMYSWPDPDDQRIGKTTRF